MAVWTWDDQDLDWQLARNGPVAKYFSLAVLSDAIAWLEHRGYRVASIDASHWTQPSMHADIARSLDFPEHYGGNLAALSDCLGDLADQQYGWNAADTGLVLALTGFDVFSAREARLAYDLLDVLASAARTGALLGNRLLVLVQSNDPQLEIAAVGGMTPRWNPSEWQDATRLPAPPR